MAEASLGNLDDYVAQHFGNAAQAIADSGIEKVRKYRDTQGVNERDIEEGFSLIRRAVQEGVPNLKKLTDLGYALLVDFDVKDRRIGARILDMATVLGVSIDKDRIAMAGYGSTYNQGSSVLRYLETERGIKFDQEIVAEKVYTVFNEGEKSVDFFGRAMDTLIYAEEKGHKVDAARLGNKENLEAAVRRTLEIYKDQEAALKYMKALARWGVPVATPETITKLETVVELKRTFS